MVGTSDLSYLRNSAPSPLPANAPLPILLVQLFIYQGVATPKEQHVYSSSEKRFNIVIFDVRSLQVAPLISAINRILTASPQLSQALLPLLHPIQSGIIEVLPIFILP